MKEEFLNNLKIALEKAKFSNEKITAVINKYTGKINRMLADGTSIEETIENLGDISDIVTKEANPLLGKTKNQILLADFGIVLPCSLIGSILLIALAFCSVLFGIASVTYLIKAWSFPSGEQLAVFSLALLFLVTCVGGVFATYICAKKIINYVVCHIRNRKLAINELEGKN